MIVGATVLKLHHAGNQAEFMVELKAEVQPATAKGQ